MPYSRRFIDDIRASADIVQIVSEVIELKAYPLKDGSKMPIGVQRKRTKGYKLPPNTKSVCRPGEWGNPHKILAKGCEAIAVSLYEQDLLSGAIKDRLGHPMLSRVGELRGYNLACFCPLDRPCHRDVLLKLANKQHMALASSR
jgi:Domain of unknown function (DUF4326)